jgi:uncharacterized protein (TIGR02996 family)
MNEREWLIQGCEAAPTDPVPRLAMADWYEEQGDTDRAVLLRLAASLWSAPYPGGPTHPAELSLSLAQRQFPGDDFDATYWRLLGTTAAIGCLFRLYGPRAAGKWAVPSVGITANWLVRCELYACRVISVDERNAAYSWRINQLDDAIGCQSRAPWHLRDIRLLGGGKGGRGVRVAASIERFILARPEPSCSREVAVAARSWHLSLVDLLRKNDGHHDAWRRVMEREREAKRAAYKASQL